MLLTVYVLVRVATYVLRWVNSMKELIILSTIQAALYTVDRWCTDHAAVLHMTEYLFSQRDGSHVVDPEVKLTDHVMDLVQHSPSLSASFDAR